MYDPRWEDAREHDDGRARVYDGRDRADGDPRDGLMHDLDLPRGEERELVVDRDRVYELNGDDSRTLAAVGTFRVVPEQDLDADHDTLGHLRAEGLVEAVDVGGDERGLVLTKQGRDLLESHTMRLATALREHRHLRSARVLCRNSAGVSADVVKHYVERAARRARLSESGLHRLRHTFCSHLAMRGVPHDRSRSSPATRT